MDQNSINMLACLASFGTKPIDILLEVVQFELYALEITESDLIKKLSHKLQSVYDITIPDILLTKWIDNKFTKQNNKLVLNTCKEDIRNYIAKINDKEKTFNKEIAAIRKSFQQYANETYTLHFNNEEIKEAFNNYFYIDLCYQQNDSLNKTNKSEISFVFSQYMRHLWEEKSKYLETIENFGVVNQIRKIVINEDNIDKKFLEDCNIYIDTPIMMKALGYDGKALGDSYTELINKLKEAGAKVCFFEHSFDELWGILFGFKKNIAQNFLDAKGVNQFLRAREEYKNNKELSLDKEVIRNEIQHLGCDIRAHIDEKELDTDTDFQHWSFDENKLTDIINNKYHEQNVYQSRIEKDVKSIAAIARLREKNKIKFPNSYKQGKFFLLTDNYTLIKSLKDYYQDSDNNKSNELIFENTILFELWQNLFDNNTFNKALFRSKCFAFTEIDDKFKEKLYKICRQMDRYEPEKNMSDQFIEHPELEEEIYTQTLSKKNYDDEYLKKIINNTVKQKEEKFKQETMKQLNDQKSETKRIIESAKVKDEEYKLNIEKVKEQAANDIQKLINKKIERYRRWWKFLFWIKKLFTKNKTIDESTYYESKAKKLLGIE